MSQEPDPIIIADVVLIRHPGTSSDDGLDYRSCDLVDSRAVSVAGSRN